MYYSKLKYTEYSNYVVTFKKLFQIYYMYTSLNKRIWNQRFVE